ncbi:MAG TPA: hypothetical protein VGE01_02155 [Fimbriimonas sp.]
MKEEVKTPLIIAAVALLVIVVAYFGFKTVSSAGSLDQGQIEYTPGKPPWEETDPAKRGPGGAPGGGGFGAPQGGQAPGAGGPPPGMPPPTLGNQGG